MAWIKQNLLFVIGGVIALAMLAAGVFYCFNGWHRNATAINTLDGIYTALAGLNRQPISPGNDQVNNIAIARKQAQQLDQWMRTNAGKYFQPIAPVPDQPMVSSQAFANALRQTIYDLQREAADASVALPPDFSFSFTAERTSLQFSSPRTLAEQLGEVQTLSQIFFAAHVNSLLSLQRVRATDDDANGPQSDYLDDQPETNNLAVLTPYQVTFCGFSSEIAQVLSAFASSPHGFIVKGINVQPAETTAQTPAPPAPLGRGGLQTVLDEQLLRVTLEVEIVKLSSGS